MKCVATNRNTFCNCWSALSVECITSCTPRPTSRISVPSFNFFRRFHGPSSSSRANRNSLARLRSLRFLLGRVALRPSVRSPPRVPVSSRDRAPRLLEPTSTVARDAPGPRLPGPSVQPPPSVPPFVSAPPGLRCCSPLPRHKGEIFRDRSVLLKIFELQIKLDAAPRRPIHLVKSLVVLGRAF